MKKQLRGSLLLLLTALIWGGAFVAQSEGMDYVAPFTYNAMRTLLGGFVLLPVILIMDLSKPREKRLSSPARRRELRTTVIGGAVCGLILAAASSFQQFGIAQTTVGKAGFVTALYIVLVPILGIFVKKKIPPITWLCVVIAVIGFYLLCIHEDFTVARGDLLVLCCAVVFSFHILAIDRFTEIGVDGVLMSCVQFLVGGFAMLICMFIFEEPTVSSILSAKWTILYAGVLSCGVAYTLQIIGQRDCEPTTATLIMSLESVFSALFGWLILHENMSFKEFSGCALVFLAVILAQIPVGDLIAKMRHKQ